MCTPLAELLKVALLYQSLDISLPYVELAVLRERDRAVLGLDLSSIFENSHVDENVLRRFQTSSEVNFRPLTFVGGEQVAVLMCVLFLFRAQAARCGGLSRAASRSGVVLQIGDVYAVPTHLLQLVSPHSMVREQAPFIPSHAEMVD